MNLTHRKRVGGMGSFSERLVFLVDAFAWNLGNLGGGNFE